MPDSPMAEERYLQLLDDSERSPLIHDTDEEGTEQDGMDRAAVEKSLLRKLDRRMSILILIYILNYVGLSATCISIQWLMYSCHPHPKIDRNNAAAARLRGFEEDLNLSDRQFDTVLSILYVGYIIMQIPSNMFLNSTGKPSVYLPICMVVWGALSVFMGYARYFSDVLFIRFCLGFVEAAFFPGALFLLSKWYKREELGQRTALLQCGNLLSNAFGTLIASGILNSMDGVLGYTAWRWLFFVEGALTIIVAVSAIFILPDFPTSPASWLTKAEHLLAQKRMQEDAGASDDQETETSTDHGHIAGLKLALADWKVWWLAICQAFVVTSLSFSSFFPTLMATLGFNTFHTLLLCAPPWILASGAAWWTARHSDLIQERFAHIAFSLCLAVFGFAISMSTMNGLARYASSFLMAQSYSAFIICMAWASNTVLRPASKRAVALAIINTVGNFGNIFGSFIWPKVWEPTYANSYAICMCANILAMLMFYIFRLHLSKLNEKLAKQEIYTEGRQPGFRYFL